jgi:hypothetical protein
MELTDNCVLTLKLMVSIVTVVSYSVKEMVIEL